MLADWITFTGIVASVVIAALLGWLWLFILDCIGEKGDG